MLHEIEDKVFLVAVVVLAIDILALADTDIVGRVDGILGSSGPGAQQDVPVVGTIQHLVEVVATGDPVEGIGRRLGNRLRRQRRHRRAVILKPDHTLLAAEIDLGDGDVLVAIRHGVDRFQRVAGQIDGLVIARTARRMVERRKLRQRHIAGRAVDLDRESKRASAVDMAFDQPAALVDQQDLIGRVAGQVKAGVPTRNDFKRKHLRRTGGVGPDRSTARDEQVAARHAGITNGACRRSRRRFIGGIGIADLRADRFVDNQRCTTLQRKRCGRAVILEPDHALGAEIDLGDGDILVAIRHGIDSLQRIAGQIDGLIIDRAAGRMVQRCILRQRHIAGRAIDLDREGKRAGAIDKTLDEAPTLVDQQDLVGRVAGQIEPGVSAADDFKRERYLGAFLVLTKRRTRCVEQIAALDLGVTDGRWNTRRRFVGGIGVTGFRADGLVGDKRCPVLQGKRRLRTIVLEPDHLVRSAEIDLGAGDVLVAVGYGVDRLQHTIDQIQCLVVARATIRMIQRLVLRQRDIAGRSVDLDLEGNRVANSTLDRAIVVHQHDLIAGDMRCAGQVEACPPAIANLQREGGLGAFFILASRRTRGAEQRGAQNRYLAQNRGRFRLGRAILATALVDDDRHAALQRKRRCRTVVLERDHAFRAAEIDLGRGDIVVAVGHGVDCLQHIAGKAKRFVIAGTAIRMIQRLVLRQRDIAGRSVDFDLEGKRAIRAANAAFDHTIALVEQPDLVAGVVRRPGQVKVRATAADDLKREGGLGALLILASRRA